MKALPLAIDQPAPSTKLRPRKRYDFSIHDADAHGILIEKLRRGNEPAVQ
jgi:hypothetical protein